MDNVDNSHISSKHLHGSSFHLNRCGEGQLAMKLIKLGELRRKNSHRISRYCLSTRLLIVYVIIILQESSAMIVREKRDTSGLQHFLEAEHGGSSTDFQDTGNETNALPEIRIKNTNQLIL